MDPAMNLPTRLVFHHVARAGGFEAARPALGGLEVSGLRRYVRILERELGVTLLHRQPFRLTPAGRILYEYDRPHLEALLRASDHLSRKTSPRLRVGVTGSATKLFLLPAVAAWLADPAHDPIECRFGSFRELRPVLATGELDLLVTALDGPPPPEYDALPLAAFRQVLIVPADWPLASATDLWRDRRPPGLLIAPEADDPVTVAFDRGLRRGEIEWPARLTCDSPATLLQLVANRLGYGLSLAAAPVGRPSPRAVVLPAKRGVGPAAAHRPGSTAGGIKVLPLAGFDTVAITALWRPDDTRRLLEPLRLLRRLQSGRLAAPAIIPPRPASGRRGGRRPG
jgi:DNA-binding transcriptional LysR family regulator